jgi:glycosyltransferase involved in cell wall biosynthesis
MPRVASETENPPKAILLVSYWYPPAIGAAAERIGAFARYLPAHGWRPHVLTAKHTGAAPKTERAVVHAVPDPLAPKERPFPDYDPTAKPSTLKRLLRERIFPDRFGRWQRAALGPSTDVTRRNDVKLLLASFPPASVVLLALRLHDETGVPLVLDFRDRWMGPGGYEFRGAAMRRKHDDLQRAAAAAATAMIAVSKAMADAIAEEQAFDRDRILVIPNGYEPAEHVVASHASPAGGPFTIAHVGTVIQRNRPDTFFDSITTLMGRECLNHVTFKFVGNLAQAYIRAAGLSPVIASTGLLPREQALGEMHAADALLLLTGRYVGRWGHNAKLFEYIQTGRPILCLEESPDSNDRKLLTRFAPDRTFIAPVDEPHAIADQLAHLTRYLRDHPKPALELDDAFRAYSRPELCAELARGLHELVTYP